MLEAIRIDAPVVNGTPIERYKVKGTTIHVKREDLSSPYPGPQFSKIRGLYAHMTKLKVRGIDTVGILDTYHSKAGWAVAFVANILGIQAYDFFPVYKADIGRDAIRLQQRMAAGLGAILVPMTAGAGYILAPKATKLFNQLTGGQGCMLPVGLKLTEAIVENAKEALLDRRLLMDGTWIVSASSGTIAAGLWKAMRHVNSDALLIAHLGYDRPAVSLMSYIAKMSGHPVDSRLQVVNQGYQYKNSVDYHCPFPCNPYYDLKAWKWLCENADLIGLPKPLVFWNVGC